MTTASAVSGIAGFDLDALRLPANYGDTLGVKKVLNTVHVGKPAKSTFFQVRKGEEWTLDTFVIEKKEERETYIVRTEMYGAFDAGLVRKVSLHYGIDRNNNPFFIPVPLPGEDGRRNPWHESLSQAVERAKEKWVRVSANMHNSAYDVYEAEAALSEPVWPDSTLGELIEVAFRGKIISTLDHPLLNALRGRV